MKHIFVVNPHAGKGKARETLGELLSGFEHEYEISIESRYIEF